MCAHSSSALFFVVLQSAEAVCSATDEHVHITSDVSVVCFSSATWGEARGYSTFSLTTGS